MQLNGQNGVVIQYVTTSINAITYNIYENDIFCNLNLYPVGANCNGFDTSLIPAIPYNYNDLVNFITLNKINETEVNYVFSEINQNWAIDEGSTGEPTIVRILIPDNFEFKYLSEDEELAFLFTVFADLKEWQLKTDNCTMQYLEELLPEHKAIIERYPQLIIDYKINN